MTDPARRSGRFVAFGEILLRLSPPGRELLMQTPHLNVWVAGAEANVATALARLGHEAAFVSAVPDNDLGRAALDTLRGHGVDVHGVEVRGGRMGLYFVTSGAGMRATEVVYDRAHSSFAEVPTVEWDWARALDGAERLYLSGITPALGPVPAASAIAAAEAATGCGVPVTFDGNWRGKLWERWDGNPRDILGRVVAHADLFFGNARDVSLLLGREIADAREAAEAAFRAFPKLRMIASTTRTVDDADRNRLSARIDTPETSVRTDEVQLAGIVDRIGGGDAFATGVLHALRRGDGVEEAARTGLALAALKHSLPGDASLFRQADLDAFLKGGMDVRR